MSIDPTTCKPGPYRVVFEGLDRDAFRLSHKSQSDWLIQRGHDLHLQTGHYDITVLHRLVPEAEAKTLDVSMQPWDILRAAADVVIARGHDPSPHEVVTVLTLGTFLDRTADHLEAEHRAAREALIEKAARIQCDAIHGPGAFDDREPDDHVRDRYVDSTRALADAGLLAEAGEES